MYTVMNGTGRRNNWPSLKSSSDDLDEVEGLADADFDGALSGLGVNMEYAPNANGSCPSGKMRRYSKGQVSGPHTAVTAPLHQTTTVDRLDSPGLGQSEWVSLMTSMNLGQLYDNSTPFQYILNAATTPATKMNEESLTYLNQGQSYEIKMKKLNENSNLESDQFLKSIVRVVFHERRLQYMEREQLETWRHTHPGERILDIDIPLSYGILDVKIDPQQLSSVEFIWDPRRDSGVFFKVNCISTEFTAKRHGGEKGVPLRIQVETYYLNSTSDDGQRILHCASCQVKVFKPKGADRKHKTDREKIDKRSEAKKKKVPTATLR